MAAAPPPGSVVPADRETWAIGAFQVRPLATPRPVAPSRIPGTRVPGMRDIPGVTLVDMGREVNAVLAVDMVHAVLSNT